MTMAETVKGLRAAAKHLTHAEQVLQGVNAVLESKALARDLKQLEKAQNALAELVLVAPRLDSYERATAFMDRLSEVEDMLSMAIELNPDGVWELLESKVLARAATHLDNATDELAVVDPETEWADENPDEDEDDE